MAALTYFRMYLLKKLLGISETKRPKSADCWRYSNKIIEIFWADVPELRKPCGAIRLEGKGLPEPLLVVYGIDGRYHVFRNRCSHQGKRLDPVIGTETLRSCGLPGSTFDYQGNVLAGPAKHPLRKFPVETNKCRIIIRLR